MSTSDVLDTLLRLGKQIGEAVKADDWSLVSELVDRRSEAVQQLRDGQSGGDFSQRNREKMEALAAQNESLAELLRRRRNEIEKELAQIGDLKHAQDSYEENSIQGSVLPSELTG